MLKYDRIDISERIDVDKTNESRECKFCHYWYFLNKNVMVHILVMVVMIKCKDQQILKILLLFILKKVHTEFIFNIKINKKV